MNILILLPSIVGQTLILQSHYILIYIYHKLVKFPFKLDSGWWFGPFFIFHNIWNSHPKTFIFSRGVGQPPTCIPIVSALYPHLWASEQQPILQEERYMAEAFQVGPVEPSSRRGCGAVS